MQSFSSPQNLRFFAPPFRHVYFPVPKRKSASCKSWFRVVVANVNVDGNHLTQIKKRNIQQRLPIIYCGNSVSLAGEEWGENENDWVEKVGEKKMAAVFSYDRARGSR